MSEGDRDLAMPAEELEHAIRPVAATLDLLSYSSTLDHDDLGEVLYMLSQVLRL